MLKDPKVTRIGEFGRHVTATENIDIGKEKLVQQKINFEKLEESGLKEGKWDLVFVTWVFPMLFVPKMLTAFST